MRIAIIAFTQRGLEQAERLRLSLDRAGDDVTLDRGFGEDKVAHGTWTKERFADSDALVFVGAVGIAVRSIAPCLRSKTSDPAVVGIDEGANWCIPLVSGHIGGANALARRMATSLNAMPVITTATDVSGVFAVDTWAVSEGLAIANPKAIKVISGMLLAGHRVDLFSEVPVEGVAPAGVDVVDDVGTAMNRAFIYIGTALDAPGLRLVPRCTVLGVGCRKDTPVARIEKACTRFLEDAGVDARSLVEVASIDLKADEPGLVEFCRERNLPFLTFPAETLKAQGKGFTASAFVGSVTGVDNVCERAAVAAGGRLTTVKTIVDGVTFALAEKPWKVTFPILEGTAR